jgi:hypothetical protein
MSSSVVVTLVAVQQCQPSPEVWQRSADALLATILLARAGISR